MFQPHVDEDPRLNEFREAKTFPVLRNLASIGTDTEGPTVSVRSASAKPTFRRQYSSKSELNTVPSVSSALSKQRMKKNPTLKSLASKIRMEHGDAVGGVTSPKRRTLQQSMQHLRSLQASSVETLDPMPAMQKSLIEERMKTKRVYAARFSAAVRKLDPPAPLEERILREQRRHRKLTDEQVLQQALEKLATKAKHWDRGWVDLSGFQGREMSVGEFRDQLKRSLLLRLSEREARAVVEAFDDDGNGAVDGAEFLQHFFRLGRAARRRDVLHNVGALQGREAARKAAVRRAERDWEEANRQAVAEYSPEERAMALGKVGAVAVSYKARSALARMALRPFENVLLAPVALRDQLRNSFGLTFTNAELGALMDHFDTDKSGTVDGAEFLHGFFEIGRQHGKERQKDLKESNLRRKENIMKRNLIAPSHLGR